ncbi:MAG: alpha/beta hydrolase fold domain-containing protein [Xanthomonadales bacterium]|nr:alpha/beta hydrolase [Xanthomonadales bacterium]NIQ94385.1 alpha/beta hydrolase [Desulfuromonadales bacterium]NIX11862.1 alpha/beta hydrolase fold domain-containing protein [Xanthomonadales bacterium]
MEFSIRAIVSLSFFLSGISIVTSAAEYPSDLPDAHAEVYRATDEADLKAWVFSPPDHESGHARPAIVFFFGGGWNGGSPGQFEEQARYLANRGMVAILADYRVRSRNGTLANIAVQDAKAAIRWVRTNASRLGVDPDRIAAGGGSAGGHLAAATATLPGHDDPVGAEDVSPVPDALVLFNPVPITAAVSGHANPNPERFERLEARLGAEPESMSPYHHVRPGLPPTIIFHGTEDKTVPFQSAELFCEAMKSAGNRCELVAYDGQGHGFFNHGRGDGSAYADTMRRTDAFLVSLRWLAEP